LRGPRKADAMLALVGAVFLIVPFKPGTHPLIVVGFWGYAQLPIA